MVAVPQGIQNPAYSPLSAHILYPEPASSGPQIAVSASRPATARGLADSIKLCRLNS